MENNYLKKIMASAHACLHSATDLEERESQQRAEGLISLPIQTGPPSGNFFLSFKTLQDLRMRLVDKHFKIHYQEIPTDFAFMQETVHFP